ncbi:MAG: hypothetical protein ABH954_00750 [Candidatus Omnitrophota bacterium]
MRVNKLDKLPKEILGLLRRFGRLAEENGYLAFVVGGVVRDLFLGRKNFDFDIVIEGDGIDFAKKISKEFKAELTKHERFNTAVLVMPSGLKIDVATARKEVYGHPGALPEVTAGRIIDDLYRRDFSINAMAIDITPGGFGTLIDFFDGLKDLRDKKIKVLHDLSFIDDPTRVLRAIRFEQRFKFKIEGDSFDLIKQAIRKRVFETVKPPRIWQELYLVLNEAKPKSYIQRLAKVCGLYFIHPKLKIDRNIFRLFDAIERSSGRTNIVSCDDFKFWIIYFMALTDRLKLIEIKKLAEKFNLKRNEKKKIYSYKNVNKNLFEFLGKQKLRQSQVYIVLEPLSYEALLLLKIKAKNQIAKKRIGVFLNIYNKTKLSINGHDLKLLGVKLDNRFKNVLDKVFYKKLDGGLETKKEELAYASRLIKNL